MYSTFYGGLGFEIGFGIAVDSIGRAFVAGRSRAGQTNDLPGTSTGFQPAWAGGFEDGVLPIPDESGRLCRGVRKWVLGRVGLRYTVGGGHQRPRCVRNGPNELGRFSDDSWRLQPRRRCAGVQDDRRRRRLGDRLGLARRVGDEIVVDPSTPSVVYAGTDGEGIYKRTSGGDIFFFSGTGIAPGSEIREFAVDRNVSSTVYAASTTGLYKSLDAGATWSLAPIPQGPGSVAIDAGSTVFANGFSGVWRSVDGGF